MKTKKIISLLVAMAVMMTFTVSALALTLAGTTITNQASVSYQNAAGVLQAPVTSTPVTTTVTQVAAVTVTANSGNITVIPGSTSVPNHFTITNNGNNADKFNIAPPTLGGTMAGATLVGVYVNSPANAISTTFDGTATATALNLVAGAYQTPFINCPAQASTAAAGVTIYPNNTVVFFVYNIPGNAANGATLIKTSTVTSNYDATKSSTTTVAGVNMTDTVAAGVLGLVDKKVRNAGPLGTASSAWTTVAQGAPGDVLEYRILVQNTGTGDVKNVVLTDDLTVGGNANTTYQAGSDTFAASGFGALVVNSQVATTATATNRIYLLGSGTVLPGTGGTIPAGGIVVVTFQVKII